MFRGYTFVAENFMVLARMRDLWEKEGLTNAPRSFYNRDRKGAIVMHMFKRKIENLRQKAAVIVAVAVFSLSLGGASIAEAGWGSIIGAGIQMGAQHSAEGN